MVVPINGWKCWLWRVVDANDDAIDILVQPRRNAEAAWRVLKWLISQFGQPRVVITETANDVFLLAPLGIGFDDDSASGSLVVACPTGREIKNCLEFQRLGNPNLPGQYFSRFSGIRFRYDPPRPLNDTVAGIEIDGMTWLSPD